MTLLAFDQIDPERISKQLGQTAPYRAVPGRWPKEKINNWYRSLPWLAGTNYYPSTAINQIDMWQASTWDPVTIEKELQWSEELGFNTHRVYLHDQVWQADEQGLYQRMDQFLSMCTGHGIRPFFVFFDDCHFPEAQLGPQPPVVPAYHNSGWVTCPNRPCALRFAKGEAHPDEVARLKGYVQNTLKRFADDERVLMWELYNEPGRGAGESGRQNGDLGYEDFGDDSAKLNHQAWVWAREINPCQPICTTTEGCVGEINWSINALNSDVHSIHNYGKADQVREQIAEFRKDERPLFMTEYLARENGSTFQEIMPLLKDEKVAALNWGFVSGKTGTIWPWQSRYREGKFRSADDLRKEGCILKAGDPYPEPESWFHDILREDGSPYNQEEIDCIKKYTGSK